MSTKSACHAPLHRTPFLRAQKCCCVLKVKTPALADGSLMQVPKQRGLSLQVTTSGMHFSTCLTLAVGIISFLLSKAHIEHSLEAWIQHGHKRFAEWGPKMPFIACIFLFFFFFLFYFLACLEFIQPNHLFPKHCTEQNHVSQLQSTRANVQIKQL